eukprot:TRINITY_DN6886_c0_g1_i1.p1 TRINITY_DN6886_c0_g1~~TRINITY_DN6886_c0_g1_i1.p1  ORF type:complete len:347 (+),score=168.41 TRINITY_DN6886_c0_g1_i1:191-1231(+)
MSTAVGYLKNATALVTGGGKGIGRGISLMMASRGARIGVADLDIAAAEQTARDIESRGGIAIPLKMDVTNEDQVNDTVEKLSRELGNGRLDVLVANAGVQHIEAVIDLEYANWKKIIDVHLNGSFLATRAAMRKMKIEAAGRKGGRIIYIGSVHSKEASVLKAPYVTAKHGIMGLMKSVAKEGAEYGISSNTICPGFVLTDLVLKQIPEQAKTLGISEEDVKTKVMLKNTRTTASVLKAPYVTAKHGIMGLMKSVAKEGAEYGISSNTICPGFVLTDLVLKQIPEQAKTLGISEEDVKTKVMLKNTVDGIFTTIDEVSEAVCFMADQTSNPLTGQSLTVSHGWNMS